MFVFRWRTRSPPTRAVRPRHPHPSPLPSREKGSAGWCLYLVSGSGSLAAGRGLCARDTLILAFSRQGRRDLSLAILAWFRMDTVREKAFASARAGFRQSALLTPLSSLLIPPSSILSAKARRDKRNLGDWRAQKGRIGARCPSPSMDCSGRFAPMGARAGASTFCEFLALGAKLPANSDGVVS